MKQRTTFPKMPVTAFMKSKSYVFARLVVGYLILAMNNLNSFGAGSLGNWFYVSLICCLITAIQPMAFSVVFCGFISCRWSLHSCTFGQKWSMRVMFVTNIWPCIKWLILADKPYSQNFHGWHRFFISRDEARLCSSIRAHWGHLMPCCCFGELFSAVFWSLLGFLISGSTQVSSTTIVEVIRR